MATGMVRALSCPKSANPEGQLPRTLAGGEVVLTGFKGRAQSPEQRRGYGYSPQNLRVTPLPMQVLSDGSGQAPAHILATEDEGTARKEAGQGLRPAPGGGEGEAPAGEGLASLAEAGAQAAPVSAVTGPGEGNLAQAPRGVAGLVTSLS